MSLRLPAMISANSLLLDSLAESHGNFRDRYADSVITASNKMNFIHSR